MEHALRSFSPCYRTSHKRRLTSVREQRFSRCGAANRSRLENVRDIAEVRTADAACDAGIALL